MFIRKFSIVASLLIAGLFLSTLLAVFSLPNPVQARSNFAELQINFSESNTVPPAGYLRDHGQGFALRTDAFQGGGSYSYGWVEPGSSTPKDLGLSGRNRGEPSDVRLATLMYMDGIAGQADWEIAIPNGFYSVTVTVGDASFFNGLYWLNIEDRAGIVSMSPTSSSRFFTTTQYVWVTDGRLTLDQRMGDNTKINYVDIVSSTAYLRRPTVAETIPAHKQSGVPLNGRLEVSLELPNGPIDPTTVDNSTVQLVRVTDGQRVPTSVQANGEGDKLILQSNNLLDASTMYVFEITDGVQDVDGNALIPHKLFFWTGTEVEQPLGSPEFERSVVFSGEFVTTMAIGPDGKLYAGTVDGYILRFDIASDGTLSNRQTISTVRTNNGNTDRALLGIAFDPAATADNLILWVSNNYANVSDPPAWSGKLSRLTGTNLGNIEDVVVNLPRSDGNHMTNGMAFGVDGALYFLQGSNTAMGAADSTWGFRPERLLSAAVLRLDTTAIMTTPLDVKTSEGGTYDPLAVDAPLTIFATGTRNPYDLVWHSNGSLYVPTNGSRPGGSTPGTPLPLPPACATHRIDLAMNGVYTGPQVITLTGVTDSQSDYMYRAVENGYYGHPNPARCEWVMNGGNPTAGQDIAEVSQYPIGTDPDRNWRGATFDFGLHQSPNGIIEYMSESFGGYLQGKLIVARYSEGNDLIVLTPDEGDGDIIASELGIPGFTGLTSPLDIVEDTNNGHLYVAGFTGIWLLRPIETDVSIEKSVNTATVLPLETMSYTLVLRNEGGMVANNVVFTDTLPAGLTATTIPSECDPSLVCNLPSLAVGETATVTIGAQVLLTTSAIITNYAEVSFDEYDTNFVNDRATVSVMVEPAVDLQIGKQAPLTAPLSLPLVYTLVVTNSGPSVASGVMLTDVLPADVTVLDVPAGCTGSQTIICPLGDLPVGSSVALTLSVLPTATGQITNTALVTANEIELASQDNQASATTWVRLETDMSIGKSVNTPVAIPLETISYTLVIHNEGVIASNVVFTDVLPAGLIATTIPAECNPNLVCGLPSLAAGETATFTIGAQVMLTSSTTITNYAAVSFEGFDTDLTNNTDTIPLAVEPAINLQIDKQAPLTVPLGTPISYTLVITNSGPSVASGVVVTDELPADVAVLDFPAGCVLMVELVCSLGNLAPSDPVALSITLLPTSTGPVINTAHVTANEIELDMNNNQDSVTTWVQSEIFEVSLDHTIAGTVSNPNVFMATITPVTVTQPLSYVWEATNQTTLTNTSGLTDVVSFTWQEAGLYTVTVTAFNEWGIATSSETLTVEFQLFLPIIISEADYDVANRPDFIT